MARMKLAGAVLSAAIVGASLIGVADASSAQATEPGQEEVGQLAEALQLPEQTLLAVERAYAALTPAEKDAIIETLRTDPSALIESKASQPVEVATKAPGSRATAAGTAVVARSSLTAYLLGIPVGNFVIEFKYYATSTAVTGIIDCQGWFSGVGVSDSVRESRYIVSGRGTCSARHTMTFLFKGSPISWNKLHTFTTRSGSPRSLTGTLSNV